MRCHCEHFRQESRATVAMLAPAVHIMHQGWKGMAWVTDGIEEEDPTRRDSVEQVNFFLEVVFLKKF